MATLHKNEERDIARFITDIGDTAKIKLQILGMFQLDSDYAADCVVKALQKVVQVCEENGIKFNTTKTPVREKVFVKRANITKEQKELLKSRILDFLAQKDKATIKDIVSAIKECENDIYDGIESLKVDGRITKRKFNRFNYWQNKPVELAK